ncbi:MAG: hypothetical protein E7003_07025 [Eggerthellaceae bacterium]|nr:hypothetical protein [Eggerthellaceae bacterium]
MSELRDTVIQTYGENEPVLAEDLLRLFNGITRQAVYKKIDAALASGELARYDRGVYYAPRETRLGKTQPSAESVLRRRWLINADGNTIGYVTGAALANETGLTEQVPAVIEVVTNTESTRVREVAGFGGWMKIRLRRPRAVVTDENVNALRFLDLITAEPVSSLDENAIGVLKRQAEKAGRGLIYEYVSLYPAKTSKRLIECEKRNVFA